MQIGVPGKVVNVQAEADRLLEEAVTTGCMTLENGAVIVLTPAQLLRVLALVKQQKVATATAPSSVIPDDFALLLSTAAPDPDASGLDESDLDDGSHASRLRDAD